VHRPAHLAAHRQTILLCTGVTIVAWESVYTIANQFKCGLYAQG
jgi:hypothetical protein